MSELYNTLKETANLRRQRISSELEDMEKLAALYEGEIPSEYEKYFPEGTPKHIVNYIRLAWDDLAQSIARRPEIQADPYNSTDLALSKSQKLEKIVQGYFNGARPYSSMFLYNNAWNLVGLGVACAIVVPDTITGVPRFEPRDPRTALPGAKRRIGTVIDELKDIIFEYEITAEEAVEQGLAPAELANSDQSVKVLEYIDDTFWAIATETGQVKVAHNMGMVPAVYIQTFSPNKIGISQFGEQISLMVAVSRIITQKIAYIDRVIYPITWVKGFENEIRIGPNVINKLTFEGSMGQLAPPSQLQVDRDLANLERYQRILNRNPEVRQGEVDGKGAYVGSKTLETLNDSVDNSISRFWDAMQNAYGKLSAVALQMDEQMFDTEKSISVVIAGQRSVELYKPSEDIDGRREVRVAYGFGVGGGYQAFLENVQGFQAGLVPKRRAVEGIPGGNDANTTLRLLELDKMDEALQAGFLAQANANQLDMVLWSKLRTEMEVKGISLHAAILKYKELIQSQAQSAVQQPLPPQAITQAEESPIIGESASPENQLPGIPASAIMGG